MRIKTNKHTAKLTQRKWVKRSVAALAAVGLFTGGGAFALATAGSFPQFIDVSSKLVGISTKIKTLSDNEEKAKQQLATAQSTIQSQSSQIATLTANQATPTMKSAATNLSTAQQQATTASANADKYQKIADAALTQNKQDSDIADQIDAQLDAAIAGNNAQSNIVNTYGQETTFDSKTTKNNGNADYVDNSNGAAANLAKMKQKAKKAADATNAAVAAANQP